MPADIMSLRGVGDAYSPFTAHKNIYVFNPLRQKSSEETHIYNVSVARKSIQWESCWQWESCSWCLYLHHVEEISKYRRRDFKKWAEEMFTMNCRKMSLQFMANVATHKLIKIDLNIFNSILKYNEELFSYSAQRGHIIKISLLLCFYTFIWVSVRYTDPTKTQKTTPTIW